MGKGLLISKNPPGRRLATTTRELSAKEIESMCRFHVANGQGIPLAQSYAKYVHFLASLNENPGARKQTPEFPTYGQYAYRVCAAVTTPAKSSSQIRRR